MKRALLLVLLGCHGDVGPDLPPMPTEHMIRVPSGTYHVKRLRLADGSACTPDLAAVPWVDLDQYVAGFEIDEEAVTVSEYRECARRHVCSPDDGSSGPARVSHEHAAAYCAWRGLRLPTYLEWQAAARGKNGLARMTFRENLDHDVDRLFEAESHLHARPVSGRTEWTRSSECWAADEAIGGFGVWPVDVFLANNRLDDMIAEDISYIAFGSFRCVRDQLTPGGS